MNTAARRDRFLNLLNRGATTVPEIARTLGISERTAHRDVAALRAAGHDIQATPGPGGGVRLAPNSRPLPVHFEVTEIIGLALSVAILKATPHAPFARSAEAALDRAHRALSADRQRAIRQLQQRVLIGYPSSDRTKLTLGPVDDALLAIFERCFTGGRSLHFDYVDRFGGASSRRIECVALLHHAPAWYVVAWDLDKDAPRTFRMDRIAGPVAGDTLPDRHPLAEVIAVACPEAEPSYTAWLGTPIG